MHQKFNSYLNVFSSVPCDRKTPSGFAIAALLQLWGYLLYSLLHHASALLCVGCCEFLSALSADTQKYLDEFNSETGIKPQKSKVATTSQRPLGSPNILKSKQILNETLRFHSDSLRYNNDWNVKSEILNIFSCFSVWWITSLPFIENTSLLSCHHV